jgi:hypothetical protein
MEEAKVDAARGEEEPWATLENRAWPGTAMGVPVFFE